MCGKNTQKNIAIDLPQLTDCATDIFLGGSVALFIFCSWNQRASLLSVFPLLKNQWQKIGAIIMIMKGIICTRKDEK
jgi:hypothetical protein